LVFAQLSAMGMRMSSFRFATGCRFVGGKAVAIRRAVVQNVSSPIHRSQPMSETELSRREFGAALALLAAASLGVGADEKPADALALTADALAAAVKARYGKHLTEEQLAEVQKAVKAGVFRAELLKKYPLANGDEPASAFSADV
jgi:hypothetical protein